jgi:DNA invertase Pin-like site-specific DNA recombinase
VARISTDHQDERSLADQEALYREYIERNYDGRYELQMIATRAKGERVDREELVELKEAILSRKIDVVITEDLGRIARRLFAVHICEACEDMDTRLLALNDSVDTGQEDWRLNSYFASMRHEQYNRDTSRRIRRSHRNRFQQGGVLRSLPFCYRRRPGAKIDVDVEKIPEMIPYAEGMIQRLEQGQYYSDIADWFNCENVPLSEGSRSTRWTHQLVRYQIMNPMFKGLREYNRKMSKRINESGRRVSVKAPPEELLQREVPHLAIVDPDRYDRLIAMLTERNAKYAVANRGQKDPRKDKPKKRTRWPGQQVICATCGNIFVFGAHGQKTHMMCNGAVRYECWNGITFDADLAVPRMAQVVFDCIASFPEFDNTMQDLLREEARILLSDQKVRRARIQQDLMKVQREIDNLTEAIGQAGPSPALLDALQRAERQKAAVRLDEEDLKGFATADVSLPPVATIREQALACFKELALGSFEFAREIRRIVPRIVAYPVRLVDGGDIAIRAKLTVSLSGLVPASHRSPSVVSHLEREISVDLFDMPQRASFREQVMEKRKTMTEKQAATELGLTITAAQRAAALDRMMKDMGVSDPYVLLTAPPPELRRHLHPRYRFTPIRREDAA